MQEIENSTEEKIIQIKYIDNDNIVKDGFRQTFPSDETVVGYCKTWALIHCPSGLNHETHHPLCTCNHTDHPLAVVEPHCHDEPHNQRRKSLSVGANPDDIDTLPRWGVGRWRGNAGCH